MLVQSLRIRSAGYSVLSNSVRLLSLHARLNRFLTLLGKIRVVFLDALHDSTTITGAKRIGAMFSNVLHAWVLVSRTGRLGLLRFCFRA